MTPEQQAAVEALGDFMRAHPLSWAQYPPEITEPAVAMMMPGPDGFSDAQRAYFVKWQLEVPSEEWLAALNAKMPPPDNTIISARTGLDGTLYIGADLLSDAINGGKMAALFDDLKTLTFRYVTEWPSEIIDSL